MNQGGSAALQGTRTSVAAHGANGSAAEAVGTGTNAKAAARKRLFVSDKVKSGCHVKVTARTSNIRDQKLLRMRSTLGGYVALMQQTPQRNILPMHNPPSVGMRMKDRPLSSYLSGGSSGRVKPLPALLEPLPEFTGKEMFKARHQGSMTERREGGGHLYHNMARGFFPLAVQLGMRPKSPLVGVGGDLGKILDDAPGEQILPGRSWAWRKPERPTRPRDEQTSSPFISIGAPDLTYALEVGNGSDEKDWWRFPGEFNDVSPRTILMLPKHFIFNAAWERAVVCLCNLHFLAEKLLLFGFEDVMQDLKAACAGLDIECKKFPDLKSWQDIYGTWRSQCYEYRRLFAGNAQAIAKDACAIFTEALKENKDWGTCSQDARFALEQAQESAKQLENIQDADEAPPSEMQNIIKVGRLIDHIRIACKHGLHKCDEKSGESWMSLSENVLKKITSPEWCPTKSTANVDELDSAKQQATTDKQQLYASLTKFLRGGMKMTEQLARTTITGRSEPRWYCTHINDTYLVNDLTRLVRAIDAVREGAPPLDFSSQLPVFNVGLYLSTMGGMTLERKLLTKLVLPAVAKYLARAGINLSWIDLRSAGPEREFAKNCIVDAIRGMDACRIGQNKLFTMFVTAEANMLSDAHVYNREKVQVKRFSNQMQTQLDKSVIFMAKLQSHLQARFSSIFEAWTYFDINGDWNVSTAEFILEYKKLKMPIPVIDVLKVIDKDGYGDIDVHEFVLALTWHELPAGGKDAIDKAVAHYQLRRKTVLKAIHEKLKEFLEVQHDEYALFEALRNKDAGTHHDGSLHSEKKTRVTTMRTGISKDAVSEKTFSSENAPMPQEIVQDSVLGPEILEEASKNQGLEWVAVPSLVNSRLQRLELEYALIRNADKCEAIIFERSLPPATRPNTSQTDRLVRTTNSDSPLLFVGKKALGKLEQSSRLHRYSLYNTGSGMGDFALRAALTVIDSIATSLPATEEKTEEAQGSADTCLWGHERKLQRNILQGLQQSISVCESKLHNVTGIWKENTGDDISICEVELGAFTRQECIQQLAQWACGQSCTEEALPALTPQTESEDSNGGFEVAVMRGQAGCGLSSVCAKLINEVQQAVADSKEDDCKEDGAGPSVLYYFRRPERNNLGPDTYLVSEIRGQDPFQTKEEFQVGLSKLPRILMQEAKTAGKLYVVVIDGLSVPEVAVLLSGCDNTMQSLSSLKDAGGLRLLVTLADTHTSESEAARPLPRLVRDVMAVVSVERVRFVRFFQGLSERERCAMLHTQLGCLASTLSAQKALTVSRLQDAGIPEFLCVAATYLKEISLLLPLDDGALSLERTLEALYEFNIIPLLELIYGPKLVESAAYVLLQTRVYNVSMVELGGLIAIRNSPFLVDAETVHKFACSLALFCNISPHDRNEHASPTQGMHLRCPGIRLQSKTFRQVLARKYKMTHCLDPYELPSVGNQPQRAAKSDKEGSTQTIGLQTLKPHSTDKLNTKSSESMATSCGEVEGIKDCDMDAVRSAMQTILTQKILEQVQVRKESKPVPPTPKEPGSGTGEDLPNENTDEMTLESKEDVLSPSNYEPAASEAAWTDQDKLLDKIPTSSPAKGLTPAPIEHTGLYQPTNGAESESISRKMQVEPTVYARAVRELPQMAPEEEVDVSLIDLQQRAMQHDAIEERVSSLTHGADLHMRHMWEALQASQLFPSLDVQIEAAENPGEDDVVPEMMVMKHQANIAKMKQEKSELIKLWAGAKMDVMWRALSVCNLDVSCRLESVLPGVYTACWHIKLSANICDFCDIHCTLGPEEGTASAGPRVHAVMTVMQQDAVKTGNWTCVVVSQHFFVAEACDIVAGLSCQGMWLSGLIIDAFALVPVPKDQRPPLPHLQFQ